MAKVGDKDIKTAGALVKALREKREWSQRDLAERTDNVVGHIHIARLERGEIGAKLEKIDALAVALEMTKTQHALFRGYFGYGPEGALSTPSIVKRLEAVEEGLSDLRTDLGRLEDQLDRLLSQ